LTKYLKYLISLFLAFGLMANDGVLDSRSNSADYYQFSNAIACRQLGYSRSKLYVFNQTNASEKTAFPILITYLQFAVIYSLQIKVLVKLRAQFYQKVSSFIMHRLFINEMITSRNSLNSLYIA
jgi:hypothetical protein